MIDHRIGQKDTNESYEFVAFQNMPGMVSKEVRNSPADARGWPALL